MTPNNSPRPIAITVISSLFILMGTVLLLALLFESPDPDQAKRIAIFQSQHSLQYRIEQHLPLWLIQIFTIACGILLFLGVRWGRWLLIAWMLYHLLIAYLNSPQSAIIHGLIFAVILFFVFERRSSRFFARK